MLFLQELTAEETEMQKGKKTRASMLESGRSVDSVMGRILRS